jgi:hypothetical protein
MDVDRCFVDSECMGGFAARLTKGQAGAHMQWHTPPHVGSLNVVTPLPPNVVPSKENSAWF